MYIKIYIVQERERETTAGYIFSSCGFLRLFSCAFFFLSLLSFACSLARLLVRFLSRFRSSIYFNFFIWLEAFSTISMLFTRACLPACRCSKHWKLLKMFSLHYVNWEQHTNSMLTMTYDCSHYNNGILTTSTR